MKKENSLEMILWGFSSVKKEPHHSVTLNIKGGSGTALDQAAPVPPAGSPTLSRGTLWRKPPVCVGLTEGAATPGLSGSDQGAATPGLSGSHRGAATKGHLPHNSALRT